MSFFLETTVVVYLSFKVSTSQQLNITGMTERLLQFIWQFQYFNRSDLKLVTGEPLQIIFPGHYNTNQGADFLEGKIRIGNTTWVGNIELHLNEGDWRKHAHQGDPNYQN